MRPDPETRTLCVEASEVRSETDAGGRRVIRGVAVRYGSLSNVLKDSKGRPFRERFNPGAFSRALATGADVRLLVNHNRDLILGRTRSGTLALSDDPDALRFVAIPTDSAIGDHYSKAVERRDMDGASFRFYKLRDRWSGAGEATVRDVDEADLDDVSVVVYPAYGDSLAFLDTEAATRSLDEHLGRAAPHRPGPRPSLARMRLRLAESDR